MCLKYQNRVFLKIQNLNVAQNGDKLIHNLMKKINGKIIINL